VLGSIVDSLRGSHSLDAVSAAQLMPMLQHAVQLDAVARLSATATPYGGRMSVSRISALVRQPAYGRLTPEQLAVLLEVVVEADDSFNFLQLTGIDGLSPAFKQLDAATVASLMMLAVEAARRCQRGQMTNLHLIIPNMLWLSPAGRLLRDDGCQPLLPVLLAALSVWPSPLLRCMVGFAGSSIGRSVLLELLTAALHAGNKEAFDCLWWQNAKDSFTGVDLRQLLCIASRSGKRTVASSVRRLLRGHHAWDAGSAVTEEALAAQQLATD
jgi:hypothetical protein